MEENKKYEFISITKNYRNFNNNEFFCIKYTIKHYCTRKCELGKNLIETLNSSPSIDIPIKAYSEQNINKIIFLLI